MGACYLWAGTILVPAYWSGLLVRYPHHHPERRLLVYAALFLAILGPLTVMFLLHYFAYVPLRRGILPYLLGTFALGPPLIPSYGDASSQRPGPTNTTKTISATASMH
jgi:hypothetical protein